jgi:hypothetical protein
MRHAGIGPALLFLISFPGCRESGTPSGDPGALYAIEAPAVSAKVGESATARIRFAPRQGYHWNEEFPARVRIAENPSAVPKKAEFTSSGNDFHVDSGAGVLPIPVTGKTAGKTAIKATADFSMCNKDECRIFKGVAVEVPIDVQ